MVLAGKKTASVADLLFDLSDSLSSSTNFQIGSFYEFVRDLWSRGYDNPEYFGAWHVGVICDDLERCINEGIFYCAILPRTFFKSTVLGHAFSVWWHLKYTSRGSNSSMLYLSYSDTVAQYHIAETKMAIRRNEALLEYMKDKVPKADSSFRYTSNNRDIRTIHGGVFSFKRGIHTNGMIADDILKDPEAVDINVKNVQLDKIEEHFMNESMFIPNKGTPIVVLGTPMTPDDLLTNLKNDERFFVRVLPALDPVPDRKVLMPELYDEEYLLSIKRNTPRAFAREFMLAPVTSTISYIDAGDLDAVCDVNLRSKNPHVEKPYEFDSDFTVAAIDIGKKRHPSHFVIYKSNGEEMIQISQVFLDSWSYTRQAKFLNDVLEIFGIDKGYVDNTRGELEDRSLDQKWTLLTFTSKNRMQMAQLFEKYVSGKKIKIIADERQKSQIISVDGELNAPETALGHGDSFWSNAMAIMAFDESVLRGTRDIGDMQAILDPMSESKDRSEFVDRVTKLLGSDSLDEDEEEVEACPDCGRTQGWLPETEKCIICIHEKLYD